MATNIALLIDSLWVAGITGMLASLSFAEWRRSLRALHMRQRAVAHGKDGVSAGNVVSIQVTESLTCTGAEQNQDLSSFVFIAFLVSLSLFSLGVFLAAWIAPTRSAWYLVTLGVLFALSITQTIAAVWKHHSARTALAS